MGSTAPPNLRNDKCREKGNHQDNVGKVHILRNWWFCGGGLGLRHDVEKCNALVMVVSSCLFCVRDSAALDIWPLLACAAFNLPGYSTVQYTVGKRGRTTRITFGVFIRFVPCPTVL